MLIHYDYNLHYKKTSLKVLSRYAYINFMIIIRTVSTLVLSQFWKLLPFHKVLS